MPSSRFFVHSEVLEKSDPARIQQMDDGSDDQMFFPGLCFGIESFNEGVERRPNGSARLGPIKRGLSDDFHDWTLHFRVATNHFM